MHKPNSPFLAYIYELMIMSRYSMSTIEAYLHWIIGYIRFHQLRHPSEMGAEQVGAYLSYLANERHVAAKTQALALNALVFLYKTVLQQPLALDIAFRRSPPLSSFEVDVLFSSGPWLVSGNPRCFTRER